VIPTAAWYWFVHGHATGAADPRGVPEWFARSLQFGPLIRLLDPVVYDLPPRLAKLAQVLDSLALAGMIFAFLLAILLWLRQRRSAPNLAALLFALSFFAVSAPVFWDTVYGYARPFSPMLLLVALTPITDLRRRWFWLLPCVFLDLRIFFQLGPQVLGLFGLKAGG
jgi:hypothetical protein